MVIVVIMALIAIIGIGGYMYFKNKEMDMKSKKEESDYFNEE